ncbi:hypothetical protein DYH09_26985 [bacterium CPR1]|nr:hypothetical protein [bacterium CPR1]
MVCLFWDCSEGLPVTDPQLTRVGDPGSHPKGGWTGLVGRLLVRVKQYQGVLRRVAAQVGLAPMRVELSDPSLAGKICYTSTAGRFQGAW